MGVGNKRTMIGNLLHRRAQQGYYASAWGGYEEDPGTALGYGVDPLRLQSDKMWNSLEPDGDSHGEPTYGTYEQKIALLNDPLVPGGDYLLPDAPPDVANLFSVYDIEYESDESPVTFRLENPWTTDRWHHAALFGEARSQIIKLVPHPSIPSQKSYNPTLFNVRNVDSAATLYIFNKKVWYDKIDALYAHLVSTSFAADDTGEHDPPTYRVDGTPLQVDKIGSGLGGRNRRWPEGTPSGVSKFDWRFFLDCTFEYSYPFTDGIWTGAGLEERIPQTRHFVAGLRNAAGEIVETSNFPVMTGKTSAEYNFFVGGYEEQIKDMDERFLPCMYSFVSEKESDYTDADNSVYNRHISLNGRIPGAFKDIEKNNKRVGETDVGISDYFQSWSQVAWRVANTTAITDRTSPDNAHTIIEDVGLLDRYQKLIFSQTDVDLLNKSVGQKESFPMAVNMRFSTGGPTQVSSVLKESQLTSDLVGYTLGETSISQMGFKELMKFKTSDVGGGSMWDAHTWELVDWYQTVSQQREVTGSVVFGRNNSNETGILDQSANSVPIANLLKIIFLGKIRRWSKEHQRTIKEMFEEGKPAHSETILYEIEKHNDTDATAAPSQRFYIPNSEEVDMCSFVDTQVKHNKGYWYYVHAYRIVFGTRYFYMPLDHELRWISTINGREVIDTTDAPEWSVAQIKIPRYKVVAEPFLQLVKVPYYLATARVLDKPPVAPDVNFIPYKGIVTSLLLNLNVNVGDYDMMPQAIYSEDVTQISDHRDAQKLGPDDPINYVSDDPPASFEIFRMEKQPKSYIDFSTAQSRVIDAGNRSGTSYVDSILPNRKYYYTFRSVDVHNNKSFPSPIYQVEMVYESGASYLLIDEFRLEDGENRATQTSMENEIYISPSFSHSQIDIGDALERSDLAGGGSIDSAWDLESQHVVLGLQTPGEAGAESVWDKKFKFRFISKSTGRKIDVNVKFEVIKDF
ncbi:hypothetical protein CMI37_16885 [Candidatus Pacearchaeota archaeon]|nr:hypothetical protein [Candidatus Pacearchaeota archaeon]